MKPSPIAVAAGALLLVTSLAGSAQKLQPNEIPTNLPGATSIAAPPADFNPLTASDEDLAYYGFPPRPDQTATPNAYASWVKAIVASKTRIVPTLEQTNMFHGPDRLKKAAAQASEDSNTLESYNWSGYVDFSGAKSYGSSSFYFLYSDFTVPVAEQAFGACTGSWDWGSSWVGIDGDGSDDVLQAGIEYDAYCASGYKAAYYSPWYEWYPYGEVRINNLPIAPGDEYFVEVWHTSPTQGYAYLVNENTDQAVEVGFTAPSGTKLIGNSAEWIEERPEVGGSLATLTNYIADPFWDAYAFTEKYVETDPSSTSSHAIIMLDNKGNPISYPTHLGSSSFLMQDEGSAR